MQPEVPADTTTLSYWLNWRVFLCALLVVTPLFIASLMIWKNEYLDHLKSDREEIEQDENQTMRDSKAWRPCLKGIHPIWLLAFRVFAFSLLLGTLVVKVVESGVHIFYYYTQWTYTLLTVYFGFGSLLSAYGCCHYHLISSRDLDISHVGSDVEQGSYEPLTYRGRTNTYKARRVSVSQEENCVFQAAGICSCSFEVIFQISAGAVMLTDCVYWLIIFPFLFIKDYSLNPVPVNGTAAPSVLRNLCTNCESKALSVVQMVSSGLSVLKMGKCQPDYLRSRRYLRWHRRHDQLFAVCSFLLKE